MPLILERAAVAAVLDEAREKGWVIPAFGVENLTTMEAVLAAAVEHGASIGCPDLPVMLAVTNNYPGRRQTVHYTHSRRWEVGLRLFLAEVGALMEKGSPYRSLRVMLHLDHALYDLDQALFDWDLRLFSSIMFDASALPLGLNIEATRAFVERHGRTIVVEGACDQIGHSEEPVTDPAAVEKYCRETGVDLVVANLGTEHRADASALSYEGDLARAMAARVGSRLVLHGTSSVKPEVLHALAGDGICKANIWTALERDSAPALLEAMVRHAARITGPSRARTLQEEGLLGKGADLVSKPDLDFFTTSWRQEIVFHEMRKIAAVYLQAWFPAEPS